MTPSVPFTPGAALTGPATGGQYVAHDPVHLDVVEVSGTNQYNVRPLASVTIAVPLMVLIPSVMPLALEAGAELAGAELAGLLAPAAGVLAADDELPPEPHADSARARAASPAAPSIIRIRNLLYTVLLVSQRESRTGGPFSSAGLPGAGQSWSPAGPGAYPASFLP
jgi:hypothetical protein